jgi:hypothetical protein
MADQQPQCPKCMRRIMPSPTNRCMYCGERLPEVHHMDADAVKAHLAAQDARQGEAAQFRQDMSGKLPHQLQAESKARQKKKKQGLISRLLSPFLGGGN